MEEECLRDCKCSFLRTGVKGIGKKNIGLTNLSIIDIMTQILILSFLADVFYFI